MTVSAFAATRMSQIIEANTKSKETVVRKEIGKILLGVMLTVSLTSTAVAQQKGSSTNDAKPGKVVVEVVKTHGNGQGSGSTKQDRNG